MIKTYYVEDLSIEDVDKMVERGVCFDVTSKVSLLSNTAGNNRNDAFWFPRDEYAKAIRNPISWEGNC